VQSEKETGRIGGTAEAESCKAQMRVRATKTAIDGHVFDSKHEADVCAELMLQQKAGLISKLQFHPTFVLIVNGIPVCKYTPDATFHDEKDELRVIDAKGFKKSRKTGKLLPRVDREFGIKRKLMQACFGLDVELR